VAVGGQLFEQIGRSGDSVIHALRGAAVGNLLQKGVQADLHVPTIELSTVKSSILVGIRLGNWPYGVTVEGGTTRASNDSEGALNVQKRFITTIAMAIGVATAAQADSTTRLGCDGDVTHDGEVNTNDVLALIGAWGTDQYDLDGDGVTGVAELLLVLEEWGRLCNPFNDNMQVTFDYNAGVAVITGTGLADHPMGPFDGSGHCDNPNVPSDQNDMWRIPLHPVVGNSSGVDYFDQMGKVAVAINGVAFYNPFDAGGVDAPSTICMDDYNGHPSMDGRYHHHQAPGWGYDVDQTGHSLIVGYASDGYPIYGPYESVGAFAKDLTGAHMLDDCNGHEDLGRGYHYHAISFELDASGFPWVQGCWHGTPDTSNFDAGGGGGGGGCDGCATNAIPPPVCNCVHTTPGYEGCCALWTSECQDYADAFCNP
jgi:hypothetical protein